MAYVIQIVRKIKLSVIHTYLFTMLHTISIVNLTLKLNFDKLTPTIFFLIFTTEWYINIDCISESLCKSFQGGPSYGNFQPAV